MKKSQIEKICEICGKSFSVIQSRQHTAKFCGRNCYDVNQRKKTPWNKNKSYEELYDVETRDRIVSKQRNTSSKENNPMFGRFHTEKSKQLMSQRKQGTIPWNKGKTYPGILVHIDRTGKHNPYIKHLLKEENITYEEYLFWIKSKPGYYRAVRNITNNQPLHLLEYYEKRAKYPDEKDAYHLDHIYPIAKGFRNSISPLLIGDISNLQFIPWKENISKRDSI